MCSSKLIKLKYHTMFLFYFICLSSCYNISYRNRDNGLHTFMIRMDRFAFLYRGKWKFKSEIMRKHMPSHANNIEWKYFTIGLISGSTIS